MTAADLTSGPLATPPPCVQRRVRRLGSSRDDFGDLTKVGFSYYRGHRTLWSHLNRPLRVLVKRSHRFFTMALLLLKSFTKPSSSEDGAHGLQFRGSKIPRYPKGPNSPPPFLRKNEHPKDLWFLTGSLVSQFTGAQQEPQAIGGRMKLSEGSPVSLLKTEIVVSELQKRQRKQMQEEVERKKQRRLSQWKSRPKIHEVIPIFFRASSKHRFLNFIQVWDIEKIWMDAEQIRCCRFCSDRSKVGKPRQQMKDLQKEKQHLSEFLLKHGFDAVDTNAMGRGQSVSCLSLLASTSDVPKYFFWVVDNRARLTLNWHWFWILVQHLRHALAWRLPLNDPCIEPQGRRTSTSSCYF